MVSHTLDQVLHEQHLTWPSLPPYLFMESEWIHWSLHFPQGDTEAQRSKWFAQVHPVINLRNWDASKSQSSCWKTLICSLRFILKEPWNWQPRSILGQALTRAVSPNLLGITWALRALPSALHSLYFQLFPLAFLLRPSVQGWFSVVFLYFSLNCHLPF